jgi:hypothetical protein
MREQGEEKRTEERGKEARSHLQGIFDRVLLLAPPPGRIKLTCTRSDQSAHDPPLPLSFPPSLPPSLLPSFPSSSTASYRGTQ